MEVLTSSIECLFRRSLLSNWLLCCSAVCKRAIKKDGIITSLSFLLMKWQPFIVFSNSSSSYYYFSFNATHYNLTFCRAEAGRPALKKILEQFTSWGTKAFILLQRAPFHVFMAQFIIETFLPYKE